MDCPIFGISTGFVDFPGRYATTMFFAGCNFKCWYCHNAEIARAHSGHIPLEAVVKNVRELEMVFGPGEHGVVFSGGEPTVSAYFTKALNLFHDVPKAIHTNGFFLPDVANPFEAVVLSLKTHNETGGIPEDEYICRIARAMKYYDDCKYKEIRIVNIPKYAEQHNFQLVKLCGGLIESKWREWNIIRVPNTIA